MTDLLANAPRGHFRVIYLDPPWKFKSYSEKDISKMPQAHYACMPIKDIAALPVASLADPRGCWIWMWCTSPMLDQQIEILKGWGFQFKTQGQWVKLTKNGRIGFGTGHILRSASEPFIIGSLGKPLPQKVKNVRNVVMAQKREHSRKPDIVRKTIMDMWDGPYVEIFGRQTFAEWTVLGNQVDRFPAVENGAQARLVQLSMEFAG